MTDFYQLHLQFQNFMLEKGYKVRNREKLLSPIFPTTFTVSGGPDLIYKFWQGDTNLLGNHILNQPCIRHWDIEATGDSKHLSFFNMFVAESISGFTRIQILEHFYEFFTVYLKLEPARFYASYFSGGHIQGHYFEPDLEAKEIWLKLGISEDRIMPFGEVSNDQMEAFVANTVEPVGGPRTELFYDIRDEFAQNLTKDRFIILERQGQILEFFTHVLYNVAIESRKIDSTENYSFTLMDRAAIAAGFGPQRMLRILEKVSDIGDISIFRELKRTLGVLNDDSKKSIIISLDHIRGIIFLIHDGVLGIHGKKNRSKRYLFNKYLRNFVVNFNSLKIKDRDITLTLLANEVINMFSILFPEFESKRTEIIQSFIAEYHKQSTN